MIDGFTRRRVEQTGWARKRMRRLALRRVWEEVKGANDRNGAEDVDVALEDGVTDDH